MVVMSLGHVVWREDIEDIITLSETNYNGRGCERVEKTEVVSSVLQSFLRYH